MISPDFSGESVAAIDRVINALTGVVAAGDRGLTGRPISSAPWFLTGTDLNRENMDDDMADLFDGLGVAANGSESRMDPEGGVSTGKGREGLERRDISSWKSFFCRGVCISIIGMVKVDRPPVTFTAFGVGARKSSKVSPGDRGAFNTGRGGAAVTMNGLSSFRCTSLSNDFRSGTAVLKSVRRRLEGVPGAGMSSSSSKTLYMSFLVEWSAR